MPSYVNRVNRTLKSSVSTTNVMVQYDEKVATVGPKPPAPLPERYYKRRTMRLKPLSGSVMQQIDDGAPKVHAGEFSGLTLNMGSGNPSLLLVPRFPLSGVELARFDGSWVLSPGVNPDLLSQAEVKALNALRSRSGQNDPDLGMFWTERRETASLFKTAAEGLLDLAKGIARKDVGKTVQVIKDVFGQVASPQRESARVRRLERTLGITPQGVSRAGHYTLKSMSDAVLGYNLGLSPLMRDLSDAHIRLMTGDLTTKAIVKGRGRHGKRPQYFEESTIFKLKAGVVVQSATSSYRDDYEVTLKARPKNDLNSKLSSWGLTNPASMTWNGASLTFLVDYFLAVGPFLSSLSVPMEFSWVDGSWSHRVHAATAMRIKSPGGSMSGNGNSTFFERKVYASFPVPTPPLSLRNRDLTDRQLVNTGTLALSRLLDLFK